MPSRKFLLDTNLLLLWVVALADLTILRDFKRVSTFSAQDAILLRDRLKNSTQLVTTPHVLTETSNFIFQARQHQRPKLAEALRTFALSSLEIYEPAEQLMRGEEFLFLGLTDAALASVSREVVIVTMDWDLHGLIEQRGGTAINFHHYRRSGRPGIY